MQTLPQPIARRKTEVTQTSAGRFRRELLPRPQDFYEHELGRLSRPSRGWARTACPFHRSKNRSAFSINLESGAFYCFTCGKKGAGVIDFVKLRDGVDFKSAAKLLGAWDSASQRDTRGDIRRIVAERNRRRRAAEDLVAAERNLRLRYRGAIHTLEADQRGAAERLADPSITLAEAEDCWRQLQASWDELRRALAAYHLLTFGTVADRVEFIQHPDLRDAAIHAVLARGGVRDDDGRILEVIL
jgi:hypothetical protein